MPNCWHLGRCPIDLPLMPPMCLSRPGSTDVAEDVSFSQREVSDEFQVVDGLGLQGRNQKREIDIASCRLKVFGPFV